MRIGKETPREPSCPAARTRSRRPARHRRPDRRRQVRHHVPRPGAAHARHASGRRSRTFPPSAPARRSPRAAGTSRHYQAPSLGDAFKSGRTHITQDSDALIAFPDIEVIVEATGDPKAGIRHALKVDRARQAYRDGQCRGRRGGGSAARREGARRGRDLQPRLGRPAGADLRACRLGARRRLRGGRRPARARAITRPSISRRPTPCGTISACRSRSSPQGGMNPKMFNSFIDGTKSGIEMTAVCNATGLDAADRTGSRSRRRRSTTLRRSASRRRRAASSRSPARPKWSRRCIATSRRVENHLQVGTYVVIKCGTRIRAALLRRNTTCCRTRPSSTWRCTGRPT